MKALEGAFLKDKAFVGAFSRHFENFAKVRWQLYIVLLDLTVCVLQVLGTPTEDNWPGISRSEELAGYKFPAYGPESLVSKAPRLDSDGVGLLSSFLLFEAKKRLPAREALKHPYFSSFPQEVALLKDGKNDGNRLEQQVRLISLHCSFIK